MLGFPARTIVILAAVCFTALVALQVAWMFSAYEGEKALHAKAKSRFESALQSELSQNEELKQGLKDLLDHYNIHRELKDDQVEWFYTSLVQAIDFSPLRPDFDVYLDGISIVQHNHKAMDQPTAVTVISSWNENPGGSQLREAGKLCVHCILGLPQPAHDKYDYQLLLFYKDILPAFVEKLGFLIFGSLVLLILFGLLFREIMRKYNQEKNLSEAKNDFINNLTHEMQTPVFAIQMANRLIKEKTGEFQKIAPLLKIIEKETGQLKNHAAKILELASLERQQVELNKEPVELNSFIEQKRLTIELMLQSKQGSLITLFYTEPLYCELDTVHFNNVLASLADNAIKYNETVPRLRIETGESGNRIYVKFMDNGIGIKSEYLPYVTDKFFRVPNVKRAGISGFGLGLSYVKHVVELHDGELQISSEEGQGTTVTILLPKQSLNA